MGEEEDSAVIDTRALELQRQRKSTSPPSGVIGKGADAVTKVIGAVNNGYALGALFLIASVLALYFWLTLRP